MVVKKEIKEIKNIKNIINIINKITNNIAIMGIININKIIINNIIMRKWKNIKIKNKNIWIIIQIIKKKKYINI